MRVIFPMIYRWYEMLRDPDNAVDLFAVAARHANLHRRMNATLAGAYEAVGEKFVLQTRASADVDRVPSQVS
jgi:hypothetical protein